MILLNYLQKKVSLRSIIYNQLYILLFLCAHFVKGQNTILKGRIVNSKTKLPESYVSLNTTIAKDRQYSNEDGTFAINAGQKDDTLFVSAIGYETIKIPVTISTIPPKNFTIELIPIIYANKEFVVVVAKKNYLKKLGINKGSFHYGGYWIWRKGEQLGKLFSIEDTHFHYLKTIRFHYDGSSIKGTKIRVRIYDYDKRNPQKPGEDLLHQNIILTVDKKREWVEVDLTPCNVLVRKRFIVGVEILSEQILNQTRLIITSSKDEYAPIYSFFEGGWNFFDMSYKSWNPWIGITYIE
jgi:hypothetical protein